uniref:AB hydrolase-1 domain-containing protein n=1 Tax=Heligmosomoides polygyrus TaxID=6339 RepID=A0A183G4P6_HELPZ
LKTVARVLHVIAGLFYIICPPWPPWVIHKADIADFLRCDLLVFDYAGYGISDGRSTEQTVYDSVERVYKYAVNDLGYEPKDIVLIGFSLGTAAMVHIASITPDGIFCERKMWDDVRRFLREKVNLTAAWVEAVQDSTTELSDMVLI